MKKLVIVALLAWCLCGTAWAADVTLQWDANTEPDLAGYKIYQGTASGVYGEPIPVSKDLTEHTLTGLPDNVFLYFVMTAHDTEGLESDFSNEVSCINNLKPGAVIIININCGP
jgi:hypothetical protein